MALRHIRGLIAAAFILLGFAPTFGQTTLRPENATVRHLGYDGDASSVGWNPSLLAKNFWSWEILGMKSVDSAGTFTSGPYGLFGKIGPLGLGVIGNVDDTLGIPRQYYAGFGVPVLRDLLWLGASVRWLDGGGLTKSGELGFSGTVEPLKGLTGGLTLNNITANNGRPLQLLGYGAYRLLDWITLFGNFHYDPSDTLLGYSAGGGGFGASIGLNQNQIVLSGDVDFGRKMFRISGELGLGAVSGGAIANFDNGNGFSDGLLLARITSDYDLMGPLTPPEIKVVERKRDMGWAPRRAYIPVGIDYKKETRDADRNVDALIRPCDLVRSKQFDRPSDLMSILQQAGAPYPPLYQQLRQLSPNPEDIYRMISKTYYSQPVRGVSELKNGDSLAIVSKQGYAIGVRNVDAAKFPTVNVVLQVTDSTGHNVTGLSQSDFAFRDPSLHIISVKPIDSTLNVPVDIVMVMDLSGSMSEEISAVRANVSNFVNSIVARGINARIGGVLYGSIIYDTLHPTSNVDAFKKFVAPAAAIGNDEITTLAIKAATEMNFRPNAQRIFILITDDWAVQDNSRLSEADLVPLLWNTRAKLYSIITPCKNNNAVTTRLTLGKEYDINGSFTPILDEIGKDITTSYQLVYESRAQAPAVTMLRGRVIDENGRPAGVTLSLDNFNGAPVTVRSNSATGEYETEITEGRPYQITSSGGRYLPLTDRVDLSATKKGDTVEKNLTLLLPPTTISGHVKDESGRGVPAEVRIEDATSLEKIATVHTDSTGAWETELKEGRAYRLTPAASGYIPTPAELDASAVEKGTRLTQDLSVISIETAIATGATFKLKHIFFEYDKWDLSPESFRELDRLVALMNEYPQIRAEIGAHTDARGADAYNQTLSEKRAKSVLDYLVSKGVDAGRLIAHGYGKSQPVATNDTEEGRALNRRVEFKLIK